MGFATQLFVRPARPKMGEHAIPRTKFALDRALSRCACGATRVAIQASSGTVGTAADVCGSFSHREESGFVVDLASAVGGHASQQHTREREKNSILRDWRSNELCSWQECNESVEAMEISCSSSAGVCGGNHTNTFIQTSLSSRQIEQ